MDEDIRELVADYYEALKGVRQLKAKARKRQEAGYADLEILCGMEKDLEWVIVYMKKGYMPGEGKRHHKASNAFWQKCF
ncbi:MAG: hypothetical protein APF77_04100 [Clostridia bacterium BRH_c25]|nr:MAG: hypothetical protein APF77_04100 [Clostridia bacterium BRH_c25]